MSAKAELEWFLTSEKAHPDEIEASGGKVAWWSRADAVKS